MVTKVIMPQMSLTMQTGFITEWMKSVGDQVNKGEAICVVEGDKATIDIEAPVDGYLLKIIAEAGEAFPVKQAIAIIGNSPDIDLFDEDEITGESSATIKPEEEPVEETVKEHTVQKAPAGQKRKKTSPIARRIARENEIDISDVEGTGPEGLIGKDDVLAYISSQKLTRKTELPSFTMEPITETEKVMANRMSTSNLEIPHFHLSNNVDVSQANALRMAYNKKVDNGIHLTLTDLFVWAASRTLKDHKKLNASYKENQIQHYHQVNVGLAVDTPKGLMVVVIKDADQMSLAELSRARVELVTRAQAGKQSPKDLQGGTFTITNLGMYGIKSFDPIIIPGQSGILGVGSLLSAGEDAEIVNVTLACDHRIVSGVDGAKYLQTFTAYFTDPEQMFKEA